MSDTFYVCACDLTGECHAMKEISSHCNICEGGPQEATAERVDQMFKGYQARVEEAIERGKAEQEATLGVGDGSGQLFVHGTYESIKACQSLIFRLEAVGAQLAAARQELMTTLDDDFAFWSSPQHSEQRRRVYGAWKILHEGLPASTSEEKNIEEPK